MMTYTHIEDVRLVETIIIDKDDPRYAELLEGVDADVDFVQAKHGNWRVRSTGHPVSFATPEDEAAYKRGMGGTV
jgi:hypothetical protein